MWTNRSRGAALLTVLWLAAALSAIAFTVASTVRGETERTATGADGVRAYYLAAGAVERGILYILWGREFRNEDGTSRFYAPGLRTIPLTFPSGVAEVRIVPEAAKLDVNRATPDELNRLMLILGIAPDRAAMITEALVDWRTPGPTPSALDQHYLAIHPSFTARHASLEEIEELLLLRGMTPELFYGTYARDREGRLVARPGLRDCLSVYGGRSVDAATAEPAVLAAIGMDPGEIAALLQYRQRAPFRTQADLASLQLASARGRLRLGGSTVFTVRAVARLRLPDGSLSDLRRGVAAQIKLVPVDRFPGEEPIHVLRWYDNDWSGGVPVL